MKQDRAFEILKSGENTLITGPPGSGKTYLINRFIDYLKEEQIPFSSTASTGIAATHINGRTIHSWSGVGIRDTLTEKDLKKISKTRYLLKAIRSSEILIIDEVSMLSPNLFDMVSRICQEIRGSAKPFGGMQLVCSGDFFQLPPIRRNSDEEIRFITDSVVWNQLNMKVCYLENQYRHKDDNLSYLLSGIRESNINDDHINILKEAVNRKLDLKISPTKLFTHNMDVDSINNIELRKIKNNHKKYKMESSGKDALLKSLKKSCLTPETLILKKGAKVMFTKNNFSKGYVNGTLGEVISFNEDDYPIVETFDGEEIIVYPETWTVDDFDGNAEAKINQIPLKLAWAITIHKSQGMTLDAAEIDLSKSFEEGMGYVALSRVKKLDTLKLHGFNKISIRVSTKAKEVDKYLIKESNKV